MSQIIPQPRCVVSVRPATMDDLPFIDRLQKMHSFMVGWMPTRQLEGKLAKEIVLIAQDENAQPLGYCIAHDQYMKRDDVGIIYQLNVAPLNQRNLIGATLVKSVFERAAYGCRLFCCWCAQDLRANFFWEALGFVPLAFRTGTATKQRMHIFWQRRVRDGDTSTPYWYPFQTSGGTMREDRLVLPIPPGTHWRDVHAIVLPREVAPEPSDPKTLPGRAPVRPRPESAAPKVSNSQKLAIIRSQSKHLRGLPAGKAAVVTAGGLRYIERGDYEPEPAPAKPKRPPRPRVRNDPKQLAAARELRDRYLEQVNAIAPAPAAPRADVPLPQLPVAA